MCHTHTQTIESERDALFAHEKTKFELKMAECLSVTKWNCILLNVTTAKSERKREWKNATDSVIRRISNSNEEFVSQRENSISFFAHRSLRASERSGENWKKMLDNKINATREKKFLHESVSAAAASNNRCLFHSVNKKWNDGDTHSLVAMASSFGQKQNATDYSFLNLNFLLRMATMHGPLNMELSFIFFAIHLIACSARFSNGDDHSLSHHHHRQWNGAYSSLKLKCISHFEFSVSECEWLKSIY